MFVILQRLQLKIRGPAVVKQAEFIRDRKVRVLYII